MDLEIEREPDRAKDTLRTDRRPRTSDLRESPERTALSRDHALIALRGSVYRASDAEMHTMFDIGRFRTVAIEDLVRHRYHRKLGAAQTDLSALSAQGLVQLRTISNGPRTQPLRLAVLTKRGKELVEHHGPRRADQAIYARLVKAREARHDAAIYRMYHAEKHALERAGARIRRIVLDYELKRKLYSPLAKAKAVSPSAYARRQAELAQQFGLKVIKGKIPLPDLRIEYETATGTMGHVDLELATAHYHGGALATKCQAGFKFYAADGSATALSRVLEERDLVVAILSL